MERGLPATIDRLENLIHEAGGPASLITPRGWPHLGLVIVDATFSLRSNYDTVVQPLLKRYCAAVGLAWENAGNSSATEHDATALVDALESWSRNRQHQILNKQIGPGTANRGRPGVRKVDIAIQVARTLQTHRADTVARFAAAAQTNPDIKNDIMGVAGVSTAFWKYLLNLSGVEAVKPDTMVLRWLHQVVGEPVNAAHGASLIEDATRHLQVRWPHLTIRQVDHLVWRKASGRSLTDVI